METGRHVRHLGMIFVWPRKMLEFAAECVGTTSTEVMDFIKKNGDLSNLSNKNGEILWQHKIGRTLLLLGIINKIHYESDVENDQFHQK